jgi:hypothetical protein
MKLLVSFIVLSLCAVVHPANARGVASNPLHEPSIKKLTESEKIILHSVVRPATDCVVNVVNETDPGLSGKIDELIVEAIGSCGREMQVMIYEYNGLFGGEGGEAFFLGQYLDDLPTTVQMRIRGPTTDTH